MLSGVTSDREVQSLTQRFSMGELTRMLRIIQSTVDGFVRSASRRVDAELCLVNLCQPELSLDAEALNSRLTRLEDQIRSGAVTVSVKQAPQKEASEAEERPPMPDDDDAPPVSEEISAPAANVPAGFWNDLVTRARQELPPTLLGFFTTAANSPVQGVMRDGKLMLLCNDKFVLDMVNKPEVLELFARKASAALGRPVQAAAATKNASQANSHQMEELLSFGRANSGVINIIE